jgi:hypothetical protein
MLAVLERIGRLKHYACQMLSIRREKKEVDGGWDEKRTYLTHTFYRRDRESWFVSSSTKGPICCLLHTYDRFATLFSTATKAWWRSGSAPGS